MTRLATHLDPNPTHAWSEPHVDTGPFEWATEAVNRHEYQEKTPRVESYQFRPSRMASFWVTVGSFVVLLVLLVVRAAVGA